MGCRGGGDGAPGGDGDAGGIGGRAAAPGASNHWKRRAATVQPLDAICVRPPRAYWCGRTVPAPNGAGPAENNP